MIQRLQIGDTLENKYVIRRQLGEGGMGVVYEGQHIDLHMKVAIKVLLPIEADDPSMIDRFKVEARSSAGIKHPNVVEVYDFGITPDGRPFFVMELLEGESLADLLDRQTILSEREIVEIVDQVLSGLSSAHKHNVIHRDLKPENVFLARTDDGKRIVKILDFGIAKILGGQKTNANSQLEDEFEKSSHRLQTEKGVVMGTPGYMAPEILTGKGIVDTRVDLFAVGVLLFEMLTGRQPFRGDNPNKIMVETATRPVPRPTAINPHISEPMEQLCLIALAKNPEDRFQTTDEFVSHLTAAAVGRIPEHGRKCQTKVGLPSIMPQETLELDQYSLHAHEEPTPPTRKPLPPSQRPYVGRARTHRPIALIPFGKLLFFAALIGAGVYFFYYKSAFHTMSEKEGYLIDNSMGRNPSPSQPTIQQQEETVTIWIDVIPTDASLTWNGKIRTERPLRVVSADTPAKIEFESPGYKKHMIIVTPNREQTIFARLEKVKTKKRKRKRR